MSAQYGFDRFELDLDQRELRRDGQTVVLQDLPFRLLATLVERAPATVSRGDLRETLWPPGTHLDVDASLNTAVARVRDALGDEASSPRFVATVPRKGYRFVAPVSTPTERQTRAWRVPAALGLALIALGGGYALLPPRPGGTHSLAASSDARQHLLVGRHQANRRSRDGLEKAIAAFQTAAALAPASSDAYSGLAESYALLGIYDYWRPREAFGPAEMMARRALELDPESAQAHLAMALVAAVAHWDWEATRSELERALELAPDSPDVWFWRGLLFSCIARHDEATSSTERALELDPTSPVINSGLAWQLFHADRGEEAVAQLQRALELDPHYYDHWDNLKWIELTLGHETQAVEAWVRAEELHNGMGDAIRRAYATGGLQEVHRESLRSQLARWEADSYQPPYDIVLQYAALGEIDEAIAWLERSFAERETDLVGLAVDPRLDPLRTDSRFQQILEQMNFP